MLRHSRRVPAPCLAILLAVAGASCHSNPQQPSTTPTPITGPLLHFEPLVGTNWTGTASFTTTAGESAALPVSLMFIWSGVCDVQDIYRVWCAQGYNPYGWGTTGGITTKVLGGFSSSAAGVYFRTITIGDAGKGDWDRAEVSADEHRLVITSSDFSWEGRRGVTFELARVAWPANVECPRFVSCK